MLIKRVTAPTRQEAYEKLRQELGPEVEIVHAAAHRRSGWLARFGFGRQWIEVVGALSDDPLTRGQLRSHPSVKAAVQLASSGVAEILTPLPEEEPIVASRTARPLSPEPRVRDGSFAPQGDEAGTAALEGRDAPEVSRLSGEIEAIKEKLQVLARLDVLDKLDQVLSRLPAPGVPLGPAESPVVPSSSGGKGGESAVGRDPAPSPLDSSPAARPQTEAAAGALALPRPAGGDFPDGVASPGPHDSVVIIRPSPQERPRCVEALLQGLRNGDFRETFLRDLERYLLDVLGPRELLQPQIVREKAADYLAARISIGGPLSRAPGEKGKLVALVGPTGVGKTTTLAKLAGGLMFTHQLDVAFITIDTYRIAAPEQLKKYAEIVEVPVKVVFKPEEMIELVQGFRNKDVVLIDTVGRSPRNREDILDLRRFLDFGIPVETHLLLSATTKYSDLKATADNFREIGYRKILITKADETATFGSMLSLLADEKTGASYITTGQCVPDDILDADAARLASLAFSRRALQPDAYPVPAGLPAGFETSRTS